MRTLLLIALVTAVGCPDPVETPPDAGTAPEAGVLTDASIPDDAGTNPEAGPADTGIDAGTPDTGAAPCEPDCGEGLTCRDGRCLAACPCDDGICVQGGFCRPSRCDDDRRCPSGSVCLDERCVRGLRCNGPEDCADGEFCSSAGICAEGSCLVHSDCEPHQRCAAGRCVLNPRNEPALLFERIQPPELARQVSPIPGNTIHRAADMWGEWGFGGTLLDIDADGDLDLYVSSQATEREVGVASCLYRNDSLPGSLRFTRHSSLCTYSRGAFHSAAGADLDGDGYHELLLGGFNALALRRFHPVSQHIDLMANVPDDHPGRRCNVASVVTPDLNHDGRADLLVSCQLDLIDEHGDSYTNLMLIQTEGGDFIPLTEQDWPHEPPAYLFHEANTLGMGVVDLNSDGLLDLLVLNDSVIKHFDRGTVTPGGIYLRCAPTEACDYRFRPFGTHSYRHGAYMGIGMARVGEQDWLYVTDFGPNRMVSMDAEEEIHDHITDDTAMGSAPSRMLFAWGVAVDDFDRDGRDDFFVTQGAVKSSELREYGNHFDYLMLQGRPGSFTVHAEDVGLAPFTTQDAHTAEYVYASRAVLKTDLDADGLIDMVGFGMEGSLRMHREVPLAGREVSPRCTIVPRNRIVPSFGFGLELIPDDGSGPRRWNLQGQTRAGTSPWLISPWPQGTIRFPSGATARFDCGEGPGPVVVEEPDWLDVAWNGDELVVTTGPGAPEGEVTVLPFGAGARFDTVADGAQSRVTLPEGATRVMLQIGNRWVARWWTR